MYFSFCSIRKIFIRANLCNSLFETKIYLRIKIFKVIGIAKRGTLKEIHAYQILIIQTN